jgi:hypothetical protein
MYNERYHKNTEFFSKYPAEMIFDDLSQQFYMSDMVDNKSLI